MASATGIPEVIPTQVEHPDEDEPLLGRPGGASQQDGKPLYFNLVIGMENCRGNGYKLS